MRTLVIHPEDRSTTFLSALYENLEDKTVITGGIGRDEINELIKSHDRVMMMGHGGPSGLFSVGKFNTSSLIINQSTVELLKEKNNSVFIWCNADMFVNAYKLEGFYSGMFISEVLEAVYCGLPGADQDMVDESNHGFCDIVKNYINYDKEIIYENVKKEYGKLAQQNPVAFYNWLRIYKN